MGRKEFIVWDLHHTYIHTEQHLTILNDIILIDCINSIFESLNSNIVWDVE